MTLRRLLPSILVGSVLMAATMVHAQGLDTLPARTAALKCQKALLDASARFFKSELGILAKCSNKAFACVQNPDPKARDKCIGLSPAANACSQAINGVILKQDTDFGSRIDEACSGLLAPEIFGTSGLGYDFLAADCLSNSRENFADLGNVRSCLRNVYRRSIERLFAIEAPRTREIFRETGVAVDGLLDLPGYPGCDDCSIASDAKDKKLLTGCAKAITSAGITYAATAAQVLSKCALALFSCEQSPKFLVGTKLNTCRAKAEEKCETAKLKATNAQTKVAAKVTGACRAVPKEALLGRDGANLGALACECTAVNVEPVDSLNQYLACSQLHHECRVAQLVNFAVPRLSSLLEQTKSTPTLDKILCAVPKDPPAQAASFASAGSCTARICRFLRSIRGRFSGATFGSIVKTATLKPGGKSRASLSERAHATVPPPATITKVEGDVTYAPNVSREIRIQYAANQAALLRAGEEPKLLIAVARLDGSLVANDVFELGLEPSVDATTLNVAYSPEIPGDSGCSFRLVFGVANGDQTEFVPFDLEAAACNLNGKLEFGEDCDDNNIADGDGCDHNCTFTRCGNGIVTAREACDDGNANDDFCTADCTLAGGPSPTSTALVTTPTAVSATPTRTTTPALTTTVTSTPTSTVTAGPTITISPTITAVPTTTVTATVTTASTATVTATSTAAPTATVTATTTAAPTSTVTVTITATPTVTVTTSPTPTKTPITTTTPSASPTGTATFTPTPTATRTPTRTPTPTPTATIKEIVDASGAGVGATLDQAHGVAVDGSGNVYVAGYASDNAFKITSGGTITQIINASADGFNTLDHAQDIAVDGFGNVYVTGFITNNVFKIAGTTKTEIVDASGTGTRSLAGPVSVAVGGTGNVYVSGVNSDNVLKITPGGTITEIITATGDGQGHTLNGPYGLAVDSSETVYVVGNQSDNAFKITSAGTITQIIDATGDGAGHPLNGPYGIAVNASKNVYIAGDESDNAFRITPAGTITKIIDASGDGAGNTLDGAHDIAADAAGNAYVVGSSTGNAFKITAGGAIKEIIDTTGDKLGNPLQIPFGIAVDGAGNVYVTGFISKNAFKIPAP